VTEYERPLSNWHAARQSSITRALVANSAADLCQEQPPRRQPRQSSGRQSTDRRAGEARPFSIELATCSALVLFLEMRKASSNPTLWLSFIVLVACGGRAIVDEAAGGAATGGAAMGGAATGFGPAGSGGSPSTTPITGNAGTSNSRPTTGGSPAVDAGSSGRGGEAGVDEHPVCGPLKCAALAPACGYFTNRCGDYVACPCLVGGAAGAPDDCPPLRCTDANGKPRCGPIADHCGDFADCDCSTQ